MPEPTDADVISDLARRVVAVAHLTGSFRLRSGRTANEYFDKYQFESDPALLADLAWAMKPLIPPTTTVLAGLELGGVPVATALSLYTGLPVVFVRKQAKTYGTQRISEGRDVAGERLTIIEDVVTSGGQIAMSANELRQLGATIDAAAVVVDRGEGGSTALAGMGIPLVPLLRRTDLAPWMR